MWRLKEGKQYWEESKTKPGQEVSTSMIRYRNHRPRLK